MGATVIRTKLHKSYQALSLGLGGSECGGCRSLASWRCRRDSFRSYNPTKPLQINFHFERRGAGSGGLGRCCLRPVSS